MEVSGSGRALTDNVELHEVTHLGLGADLALVQSGVARLHVLYLPTHAFVVTSGATPRLTALAYFEILTSNVYSIYETPQFARFFYHKH